MTDKEVTLIFAGNRTEFRKYQREHPEEQAIHVTQPYDSLGRTVAKIIRIGTFYQKDNNMQDLYRETVIKYRDQEKRYRPELKKNK